MSNFATGDSDIIPPMLTANVEYPIATTLEEIQFGERQVGECIHMIGNIGGPHGNNQARMEVKCREEYVVATVKIQEWDLPTRKIDDVAFGETTLADYGEEYARYGLVIGETVANELGCKPDSLAETVANGNEITFTQHKLHSATGYHEPNRFLKFVCDFETDAFWELDDLWKNNK